jgi:hypothetical protein
MRINSASLAQMRAIVRKDDPGSSLRTMHVRVRAADCAPMRLRSSLPAAVAAAAAFAAGCGASSSNGTPVVTMDRAAAAQVAHDEAVAEGGESLGYETRANKAWQSRQNGEERLKRERCRRLHPGATCRVKHIKLLNR